ncbi:hypothetical protein NA57DRAFT_61001 [Rhizodiscina lignyota]|uniref:Uncharacterized protein n=1 Tax=Rhizodiscina lignyota TaxID=1504668 RepID=A0A9P4I6T2_9PEZI|nr:hypothetical protein NA57DRAFT_61001 [Rhizodiscina lignyota]
MHVEEAEIHTGFPSFSPQFQDRDSSQTTLEPQNPEGYRRPEAIPETESHFRPGDSISAVKKCGTFHLPPQDQQETLTNKVESACISVDHPGLLSVYDVIASEGHANMHERLTSEHEQLLEHLKDLNLLIAKTDDEIAHLKNANAVTSVRIVAKRKEVEIVERRAIHRSQLARKAMESVQVDESTCEALLKTRDAYRELDDVRAALQLVSDDTTAIIERREEEVTLLKEAKRDLLSKKDWVVKELLRYDGMLSQLDIQGRFLRQPSFINPSLVIEEELPPPPHEDVEWRWTHLPGRRWESRDVQMIDVSELSQESYNYACSSSWQQTARIGGLDSF